MAHLPVVTLHRPKVLSVHTPGELHWPEVILHFGSTPKSHDSHFFVW